MKTLVFLFLFLSGQQIFAATITAVNNGFWYTSSTWSCNCVPTSSDNIIIPAGKTVELDLPGALLNLNPTNILVVVDGTLVINTSSFFLDPSDVFRVDAGGMVKGAGLGGAVLSGLFTVGVTSASPIIGPITITNGTLPVTLTSFKAAREDSGVMLTWSTASEKDFDFFSVERSTNGKDFERIASVQGAGTSFTEKIYRYEDEKIIAGSSYYRLTAFDFDGSSATFKTVEADGSGEQRRVSVFPNPVTGKQVKFELNFQPASNDFLQLVRTDGSVVHAGFLSADSNGFSVPENLQPGVYLLKFFSSKGNYFQRISIE